MRGSLSCTIASVVFFCAAGAVRVSAAEANLTPPARNAVHAASCRPFWRCAAAECSWHRNCRPACPDRYSCYSLYGAYGPYGGPAYWAAYTGGSPYR